MIETLQTLMNFHSVTSNQAAVSELLEYVEARLKQYGLHTERVVHNGVNSLYASTHGGTHTKVMLQGHIDVVPEGDVFHRDGDKIFGRGCFDMLFAMASFIRLIEELDNPARYDLSILLTGDEEVGGSNGVGTIMQEPRYTCDICILPDAGEGLGTMSIGAKGVLQLLLRVNGKAHHASRPWEGDGAGGKLVSFLHELSQEFDASDRYNSTMTVSRLEAGSDALNQGLATALVGIDIRYSSKDDLRRIESRLNKLKETYDVTVEKRMAANNFSLDTSHPLVQSFIDEYEVALDAKVTPIRAHGSSDARFFDEKGIPVIMFRPDGGGAHAADEWLSISSWEKFHIILDNYVHKTAIR